MAAGRPALGREITATATRLTGRLTAGWLAAIGWRADADWLALASEGMRWLPQLSSQSEWQMAYTGRLWLAGVDVRRNAVAAVHVAR